ncbi:hypothetical protein KR100_14595 [Synechococcus sp. KORDI-100]|nr:hypothetical protein KR100_14595 [Synechococcus sp. KORDI-100]
MGLRIHRIDRHRLLRFRPRRLRRRGHNVGTGGESSCFHEPSG